MKIFFFHFFYEYDWPLYFCFFLLSNWVLINCKIKNIVITWVHFMSSTRLLGQITSNIVTIFFQIWSANFKPFCNMQHQNWVHKLIKIIWPFSMQIITYPFLETGLESAFEISFPFSSWVCYHNSKDIIIVIVVVVVIVVIIVIVIIVIVVAVDWINCTYCTHNNICCNSDERQEI